jgi:hypothetical protein
LKISKKYVKGKEVAPGDDEQYMKSTNVLHTSVAGGKNIHEANALVEMFNEINDAKDKCDKACRAEKKCDEVALERLIKVERRLEDENYKQLKREGYPWYILFAACIVYALALNFGFIPAMEYTVVQTAESSLLSEELNKFISPITFDQTLFDNMLVTSWDLKSRVPFLLSAQTVKEQEIYRSYNNL